MRSASQRARNLTARLSTSVTSFKSSAKGRSAVSSDKSRRNSPTSCTSILPLKLKTILAFADRWIFSTTERVQPESHSQSPDAKELCGIGTREFRDFASFFAGVMACHTKPRVRHYLSAWFSAGQNLKRGCDAGLTAASFLQGRGF